MPAPHPDSAPLERPSIGDERPSIGIDYGPATSHGPGVGRYARELVRALVKLEDGPDLALFEPLRGPRRIDGEPLGLARARRPPRIRRVPLPRRLLDLLGRAGLGVDRLLGGVELFHDVRREPLPVARARRTWALSELPPPGSAAETALRSSARRMDALIAFSREGAARIADRLDVTPERVHVTPVGAEHFARELGGSVPLAPSDPPYVLALGRLDRSRRPLELLAALEELRAGGLRVALVLAGRAGDAAAPVRAALARSPLGADATWIEAPRERDLPALVARAAVLCHLAPAELTAVTPLEALRAAVPVVALRSPALEEALGTEAGWLEPRAEDLRPDELAGALERALAQRSDAAAIARRLARAAPFTWEACARASLAVWQAVLARDR